MEVCVNDKTTYDDVFELQKSMLQWEKPLLEAALGVEVCFPFALNKTKNKKNVIYYYLLLQGDLKKKENCHKFSVAQCDWMEVKAKVKELPVKSHPTVNVGKQSQSW